MNALSALEFDRIRSTLASYAATAAGRSDLMELQPETKQAGIELITREVVEILHALEAGVSPPAGDVPDMAAVFSALNHRGEILGLEQLTAIRRLLHTGEEFFRFFQTAAEHTELSRESADLLRPPRELHRSLNTLITGEGALNEEAVPEIVELRRRITGIHQDLQRSSQAILREHRDMYREDRPTVRDGRTVLPLAANFKGRLDGVVHEASGSGETLFVEPRELVDLNNRLVRTHNEIIREVRRVLRDLTDSARKVLPELTVLDRELINADCVLARARYGVDRRCRIPETGDSIHLVKARHPLLGDTGIPLDISYDPGVHLMVLSGPNTGGKTVLLKTLGLLAVMHQCSIPIPVGDGSSLPVFDWIGVDIGDEQSIDEALSTFSAHLRTLAEITRRAGPKSLILLDELGTGTDQEEGAALSLAIVDDLMERGATVLVTTHQSVLKHYGYTRDGAMNAAMAFDEEEHRPTYRVITGRPGGSHALEAAREQGLPLDILDRARAYQRDQRSSVAEIITRLGEEEERYVRERSVLEQERLALERVRKEADDARRSLEERERVLKREGLSELKRTIADARKAFEQEIRNLRERGVDLAKEEIRAAREPLQELSRIESVTAEEITPPESAVPLRGIQPEMSVRHRVTGRTGTVRSVRDSRVEVQFGAIRMTVSPEELLPADTPPSPHTTSPQKASPQKASPQKGEKDLDHEAERVGASPKIELDLRGYRLEPALDELERQVDAAVMHGLSSFGVIHGMGTGVLQKGVQEYLRSRREIREVRFALPEDGGYGKTVVELGNST